MIENIRKFLLVFVGESPDCAADRSIPLVWALLHQTVSNSQKFWLSPVFNHLRENYATVKIHPSNLCKSLFPTGIRWTPASLPTFWANGEGDRTRPAWSVAFWPGRCTCLCASPRTITQTAALPRWSHLPAEFLRSEPITQKIKIHVPKNFQN